MHGEELPIAWCVGVCRGEWCAWVWAGVCGVFGVCGVCGACGGGWWVVSVVGGEYGVHTCSIMYFL
jgi:hypothetical protein